MNDIQSRAARTWPRRLLASIFFLGVLWSGSLAAQETEVGFSLGWYEPGRSDEAVEAALDVHFGPTLFWGIRPQAGLLTTSDGSVYGFGGFRVRLPVRSDAWRIDLSTAVGLFEEGDGKELGGAVEFRSGIDIQRRLGERHAVGVGFYHISNAGIYDRNPGSNTVLLRWVVSGFDRATNR